MATRRACAPRTAPRGWRCRISKPVIRCAFAFLPTGEDPDSFLRTNGAAAMKKILDDALPLSQVLWRVETEGKDFSTPERRAGLERALAEITSAIGDSTIAGYYRRDFDQKVFDAFKRRAPSPRRDWQPAKRGIGGGAADRSRGRFPPAPLEGVSSAVKSSLLYVSGHAGARRMKERALAALLLAEPELAARHGELLAELPLLDASLDSLRHELLNLAASGSSLEKTGV